LKLLSGGDYLARFGRKPLGEYTQLGRFLVIQFLHARGPIGFDLADARLDLTSIRATRRLRSRSAREIVRLRRLHRRW